jgi:hypothetical protein
MRRFSVAIPALITGVSLYFVLVFGREAIAIFSSPTWGLENQTFARAVYGIGRVVDLGPDGLVRLAAFLGALKLAVAVVFALYLADRFNPYRRGELDHDLLDAAALLAVCSTAIVALPALLEAAPHLLAPHRPALWLAGLAATLSMIERVATSEEFMRAAVRSPIVALPPRRERVSASRWDYLRRESRGF